MVSGRRNLKKSALEGCPEPQPGELLMRVVALRGSNLIEVEDANGEKTLCLLPAKFHKSLWIKRGNYVLVDEGDREKAIEAGHKVTGTISQVLFEEHARSLKKTSFWPAGFKKIKEDRGSLDATSLLTCLGAENTIPRGIIELSNQSDRLCSNSEDEEDDGLPPLEANMNRVHAMSLYETSESEDEEDPPDIVKHISVK